MSKKRPTESGWESDEDDLLTVNDGGISAFRMQDEDEIDEAALLGLDDGVGGFDSSAHQDQSGGDGQDYEQEEQPDLLEIQVDEEEVLDYEDDTVYNQDASGTTQEESAAFDTTEGDEGGDESQADVEDTSHTQSHDYYGEQQHEELQDFSQEQQQVSSYVEGGHEAEQSESDSNSEGEDHGRLRFKSERPNIISLSKAKSRTDIPDTLEVSAEQQAQIEKFDPRHRDRGRGGHRGGQHGNRGRGPRGNRDDRGNRGRPMRDGPRGRPGRLPPNFHQEQIGRMGHFQQGQPIMQNQPIPLLGHPRDHSPGQQFGNRMPGSPLGPRPLMASPMMQPPQVPTLLTPRLQQLQHERLQLMQHQQQQVRQPRKILINPNFRGPVPVSASTSWASPPQSMPHVRQEQPQPLLVQSSMPMSGGLLQHPPGPGIPSQALMSDGGPPFHPGGQVMVGQPRPRQPFGHPQGFPPQGPRMIQPGAPRGPPQQGPHYQQGRMPVPQQPQPGFGPPQQQGMIQRLPVGQGMMIGPPHSQAGMGPPPLDHLLSPHDFHGQHQSQFSSPFDSHPPHPPQHQLSPRLTSPPPGMFQQQHHQHHQHQQPQHLQQQPQQQERPFAVRGQRRPLQKPQAVVVARKLTQQAKVVSHNKNITVVPIVPLKRRSTDASGGISPTKMPRAEEHTEEEGEPMDEDLKKGLEKQKQLRELIRQRKEANRRRQAALRRQELEKKLADQGLTLKDVEGQPEGEEDFDTGEPNEPPPPASIPQSAPQPKPIKKAQPITTLVSGGPQRQQQQQQQHVQGRSPQKRVQPQQQLNTGQPGQPFQPRVPNQPGSVRPVRQQVVGQPFAQQQPQFSQQPRQPVSPHQPRPGLARQSSNRGQFQQQAQPRQPFQPQQQPRQPFGPHHQQFNPPVHADAGHVYSADGSMHEGAQPPQHQQYEHRQFEQPPVMEHMLPVEEDPRVRRERFEQLQHEFQEQERQEQLVQQQQYEQPPPQYQQQPQYQQHQQYQEPPQGQFQQPQFHPQQQQQFPPPQQQLEGQRQQEAREAQYQQRPPQQQQFQQYAQEQQFPPQQHHQPPYSQHVVDDSGDGFQPQQNMVSVAGRGRSVQSRVGVQARLGVQSRLGVQTARGRGLAPVKGGVVTRGTGVVPRDRGMSTPVVPTSPRQVVSQTSQHGNGESVRTVLPARGRGRGMVPVRGGGSPGNRVVVPQGQRQVMHGGVANVQKVSGPSVPQQVSIDNLSASTSATEIKNMCTEFGPFTNVIMIPSQKKCLVTFSSKPKALAFAQKWSRRMVNLSMVTVNLLG